MHRLDYTIKRKVENDGGQDDLSASSSKRSGIELPMAVLPVAMGNWSLTQGLTFPLLKALVDGVAGFRS